MRSTAASIMQQQHREILGHVERLDQLVAQQARVVPPNQARTLIRQHLRALREVATAHFAAEEDAGYFAALAVTRRDLRPRADRVVPQHGAIVEALDAAHHNARHWSIPLLCDKCRELVQLIGAHEQAERELARDAGEAPAPAG